MKLSILGLRREITNVKKLTDARQTSFERTSDASYFLFPHIYTIVTVIRLEVKIDI